MKPGIVIAFACVAGCDEPNVIEAEPNALGIATIEIDRGESILEIRGFDANGGELARAHVRTGLVQYSLDEGLAEQAMIGRDLRIAVGATELHEVIPNLEPLARAAPIDPGLTGFVHLAAVADALHDEGVIFGAAAGERAYDEYTVYGSGSCSGNSDWPYMTALFPRSSSSCWMNIEYRRIDSAYNAYETVNLSQADPRNVARRIGWDNANNDPTVCLTQALRTGCTSDCYFGPCGMHVEMYFGVSGAAVYGSDNGWGYDLDGPGSQFSRVGSPGPLAPSVTATCTCTGCSSNGSPLPLGCHNAWKN